MFNLLYGAYNPTCLSSTVSKRLRSHKMFGSLVDIVLLYAEVNFHQSLPLTNQDLLAFGGGDVILNNVKAILTGANRFPRGLAPMSSQAQEEHSGGSF